MTSPARLVVVGNRRPARGIRRLGAGDLLYGAILTSLPALAGNLVSGPNPPPPNWIIRLLGLRQVGQGIVVLAVPGAAAAATGATVDALHALTMIAAARMWPAHRRAALISGMMATVFAAAGFSMARRLRSAAQFQ